MAEEATAADMLMDDVFEKAFEESLNNLDPAAKTEPDAPAKTEPEPPAAEVKPEPEKKEEPAAATPAATPVAPSAAEIAAELAKLTPAPVAKEEPAPAKSAEELAIEAAEAEALEDLEKNWGTQAVAVKALLKRQEAALKDEFKKILEPLQAQLKPVVEASEAQTAEAHKAAILAEHKDAFDPTFLPAVEKWISEQPEYLRPAYDHVLDHGTAAEINKFFTDYKKAAGLTAAVPAKREADIAAEAAAKEKLEKMEAPGTVRTAMSLETDPQDFDSAWEAGMKKAV